MYTVALFNDTEFRFDEERGRFVEVCTSCGADRVGRSPDCSCGKLFPRDAGGVLTMKPAIADLDVAFPRRCPHCLGEPTTTARFSSQRHRQLTIGPGSTATRHVDVPVCGAVRSPTLMSILFILAAFLLILALTWVTISFLGGGVPWIAGSVAVLLTVAVIVLRRESTWIRFESFDERGWRFLVRRREYAMALARDNGGTLE